MVKIVTVYPKDDGESYLMDVSVDQFTEIVKKKDFLKLRKKRMKN